MSGPSGPPGPLGGSAELGALRELVRAFPSVLLGYSGGVDSALLAVVLRQELGRARMLAAIGRSASYPGVQWETARRVAERFDVPILEIDTHELEDRRYLANPTREHRPGYVAGRRAGVRSPLAEVGMTKAEIRAASRALGLPTWDAPAAPCLSSRVAYGLAITPRRLEQVERAEAYLRELGVAGDVRVRHHGDRARIEVEPEWIPWLRERLGAVTRRLGDLGFAVVEVDPRGYRRGSLILERAGGS